jgi:hypothetical protein
LQRYNVSYVAIFVTPTGSTSSSSQSQWQGFGEDGKWYWMARIGNNTMWNNYKVLFVEKQNPQTQSSTYYRLIMNGTHVVGNDTIADTTSGPSATTTLLGYMMATTSPSTGGGTTIPYLSQACSIPGPVNYGQKVLIAGNLTDTKGNSLGSSVTVDIEDSIDFGTTFNKVQTIPVYQDGSFNYTWAPDAGDHVVQVRFLGIEGLYLESSSAQEVVVNKANVTLTLKASTTNTALGQDAVLSWHMAPFVSGANVTLSYTTDNQTFVKIKSFLMTSPSMNYTWKVARSGTIRIVVTFAGDNNYNQATASLIMKAV